MEKPAVFSGGTTIFVASAVLVFLLDQVTKWIVMSSIPYGTYHVGAPSGDPLVVIPDFFLLVHIVNPGAAWGILDGMTIYLGILGLVALAAILYFRRQLEIHLPWIGFSFGLIAGGIAGNVVDRIFRSGVVDFIDIHLPALSFLGFSGYRWPAFNIADSGITVGVFLYLIYSFFIQPQPTQKA